MAPNSQTASGSRMDRNGRTADMQPDRRTEGVRRAYTGPWDDVLGWERLVADLQEVDGPRDVASILTGSRKAPGHLQTGASNGKFVEGNRYLSINAASDCPNRWTDNCQVGGDECYAVQTEQGRYPHSLDCRRRTEYLWDAVDAETMAEALMIVKDRAKSTPFHALRFNVGGDIRFRGDAVKIDHIAKRLQESADIPTYLYTASDYVDFRPFDHVTINASNPQVQGADRMYTAVTQDMVDNGDVSDSWTRCPNDTDAELKCGECKLCLTDHADDIYIVVH